MDLGNIAQVNSTAVLTELTFKNTFTPANRDKGVFGADAHVFNPYRAAPHGQRPWGLTFGSGPHICIGRPLVTGQSSQGGDDNSATYGTMVRMTRALYEAGVILDPDHPPKRVTESYYDAYSEMRILLPKL